jgi:hypothetical protein
MTVANATPPSIGLRRTANSKISFLRLGRMLSHTHPVAYVVWLASALMLIS